ncbi:hypothetical protein K402DRAFT_459437 [Aulographum hederae CBS 113979]|uniref:Uncharacterized protein n=1 Tax=Aulographum hederae CBS 113979 TaxID=1176131 RepID=A0A6G1HER4_9PEZI|nr:hypothetical protein K402DRAFT_459437 [Aulographum hederae CBS 113979]
MQHAPDCIPYAIHPVNLPPGHLARNLCSCKTPHTYRCQHLSATTSRTECYSTESPAEEVLQNYRDDLLHGYDRSPKRLSCGGPAPECPGHLAEPHPRYFGPDGVMLRRHVANFRCYHDLIIRTRQQFGKEEAKRMWARGDLDGTREFGWIKKWLKEDQTPIKSQLLDHVLSREHVGETGGGGGRPHPGAGAGQHRQKPPPRDAGGQYHQYPPPRGARPSPYGQPPPRPPRPHDPPQPHYGNPHRGPPPRQFRPAPPPPYGFAATPPPHMPANNPFAYNLYNPYIYDAYGGQPARMQPPPRSYTAPPQYYAAPPMYAEPPLQYATAAQPQYATAQMLTEGGINPDNPDSFSAVIAFVHAGHFDWHPLIQEKWKYIPNDRGYYAMRLLGHLDYRLRGHSAIYPDTRKPREELFPMAHHTDKWDTIQARLAPEVAAAKSAGDAPVKYPAPPAGYNPFWASIPANAVFTEDGRFGVAAGGEEGMQQAFGNLRYNTQHWIGQALSVSVQASGPQGNTLRGNTSGQEAPPMSPQGGQPRGCTLQGGPPQGLAPQGDYGMMLENVGMRIDDRAVQYMAD